MCLVFGHCNVCFPFAQTCDCNSRAAVTLSDINTTSAFDHQIIFRKEQELRCECLFDPITAPEILSTNFMWRRSLENLDR
jgi:hypothetical protein